MNLSFLIDLFLHLDKYLNTMLNQYNLLAYIVAFIVIFIETGLVCNTVYFLIFAIGAIAAAGGLISVPVIILLLYFAAAADDKVNYEIGCLLREKVNKLEHIPLIKMEYIERTQAFFESNMENPLPLRGLYPSSGLLHRLPPKSAK